MVIVIDGTKAQMEDFLPKAQKVLNTILFAGIPAGSAAKEPETGEPPAKANSISVWNPNEAEPPSLSAGRYTTDYFTPAFSFEVGEGWVSPGENPSGFELVPQSDADKFRGAVWGKYSSLAFNHPKTIVEPNSQSDVGKPGDVKEHLSPLPDDIIAWLQKHPYLKTSEPEPVTVGNEKGMQIDVEVPVPKEYSEIHCGPGNPCILLFGSEKNVEVLIPAGGKNRIIVLKDIEGETVTIMSNAYPASNFDTFIPNAQEVIDTVEWQAAF